MGPAKEECTIKTPILERAVFQVRPSEGCSELSRDEVQIFIPFEPPTWSDRMGCVGLSSLRVLVTGGDGFIGQHLTRELLKRGCKVFVFEREGVQTTISQAPRPEEIVGDIRDAGAPHDAFCSAKPDVVVHLAATTGVLHCLENEELTLTTNILGTYNVVKASWMSGASKIVFASSREVYGETRGQATREDDPAAPNNLYGLTKLVGEDIVKWGCITHGLRYTILRITNVYGPGGERYGIHKISRRIASGEDVTVMGGEQLLNFIYISDLTSAICKVLDNPCSDGEVFNIAGPDTMTILDATSLICRLAGREVSIKKAPMRATETIRFIADTSKAKRILGWSPEVRFRDGIGHVLSCPEK